VKVSILDQILDKKREEISAAKAKSSLEILKQRAKSVAAPRSLAKSLAERPFPAIIAEIKRASPSKGMIREDLNPIETAREYVDSGAAALSILTDREFFKGELSFLSQAREVIKDTPILRKDFVIDPYQIWESRAAGADAILLIVKALDYERLLSLFREAQAAELDVLIETHSISELQKALKMLEQSPKVSQSTPVIGVNNRNLATFEVSLENTKEISQALHQSQPTYAGERLQLVAESGIHTADDLSCLSSYGADAFLIGESLVRHGSPGENLAHLIKSSRVKTESKTT
jgi:indole-3-glycerol phosphate synthase